MIPPTLQRVIERLIYEGLLVHNQCTGHRWRMTLPDVLEAGAIEPRILELLPGLLRHRPTALFRWRRDVSKYPDLQKLLNNFDTWVPHRLWRGLPLQDLRRAEQRIQQQQQRRRQTQRWRNINIRVAETDWQRLTVLAAKAGRSKSATLRLLIEHAMVAHQESRSS